MIKKVHPDYVLITPDTIAEKTEGGIELSDVAKANLQKAQNRGVVEITGDNCKWLKKGDYAVFYRGAATEMEEDDTKFVLIHENHCLSTIVKK